MLLNATTSPAKPSVRQLEDGRVEITVEESPLYLLFERH
jgi:hypothetical protein